MSLDGEELLADSSIRTLIEQLASSTVLDSRAVASEEQVLELASLLAHQGWTPPGITVTRVFAGNRPLQTSLSTGENYVVGMGCVAHEGGAHYPGRGRDWRECVDCDEWPYEDVKEA